MKKKIVSFLICMLVCLSSVLIFPDDLNVEASGEEEGESGEAKLDYEYLWEQINATVSVIYDAYELGDIPKGRYMGSKGGAWTCDKILMKEMNDMDLNNVHNQTIQSDEENGIYYNRSLEVIDYEFKVNDDIIPKREVFPYPSRKRKNDDDLNYTSNFMDLSVMHLNFSEPIWGLSKSSIVISEFYTYNEKNYGFIGILEYLPDDMQIPCLDEQGGKVYLINQSADSQEIINNLSNASGVVIIGNYQILQLSLSDCKYQVKKISKSDGNSLIDILKNNNDTMINTISPDNISIYYDFDTTCIPDSDYFIIDRIPDHLELKKLKANFLWIFNLGTDFLNGLLGLKDGWEIGTFDHPTLMDYMGAVALWGRLGVPFLNFFSANFGKCKGFILYSSFDHRFMWVTWTDWIGNDKTWPNNDDAKGYKGVGLNAHIPMFFVNKTIGNNIENGIDANPPVKISGNIEQEYLWGTSDNPGLDAKNVIGELNIDESPKDQFIFISNRYDGMWGETPGDSGIGTGIVLALAKQMKEFQQNYNFDPKYNITYLFTTGEEIGFRGAYYHRDTMTEDEIKRVYKWIGFDQLGMNQSDVVSEPIIRAPGNVENATNYKKILNAISYINNYKNYSFEPSIETGIGASEDYVWGESICDTVVYHRDNCRAWDRWHCTGENYENGDSLKYTDYDDVNLTYKMAWEFVKYICYAPDCEFDSISHELWDSPDDDNDIPDHLNVSYTISSVMPIDRVKVKAILLNPFNSDIITRVYQINSSSTRTDYINFSLNEFYGLGYYGLGVYLYNSTGEINRNAFLQYLLDFGKYANDTYELLDSYNCIKMSGCNDAPYTSSQPTSSTSSMKAGTTYTYQTSTTDPNNNQIYYQWDYYDTTTQEHEYSSWTGPYNSGETCTVTHTWATTGPKKISVRARDEWFSPNLWSEWSNTLNVSVSPGCSIIGAPETQLIDQSFDVNGAAFGFTPDSWSWDFGDGQGTSNQQAPSYSYPSVNTYTINLTVTDTESNEYYFKSDVQAVPLKADFTVSPSFFGHPNETLNFTDTSEAVYTIINWTWDFGDGNTSYTQNTSHNYSQDGKYSVTLTVRDNMNNTSNRTKNLYVDSKSPVLISTYQCSESAPGETIPFTYMSDPIGIGFDVSINADFQDNISGVDTVKVKITKPDGTWQNYSMQVDPDRPQDYVYTFEDTIQIGTYTYKIWSLDNAGNSNWSQNYSFDVGHRFGYTTKGRLNQSVEDRILGTTYTIIKNGTADSITACIKTGQTAPKVKCMIYRNNDSTLIGTTEEKTLNANGNASWIVFNFSGTKPTLIKNTYYVLSCWSDNPSYLFYDNISGNSKYRNLTYGNPPDPANWDGSETRMYSIYCDYITKPEITGVSDSPDTVGFGFNVSISADVDGNGCAIDFVKVNISYPNNTTGSFPMNNTDGNSYVYNFSDTWLVGQYNYTIWACDIYGGSSTSMGHSFNVSAQATISVCTIKDFYGGNESINLTDPPGSSPLIGYTLLDDGEVLRIWNKYDSYYFDTDSGLQITNHYDEYWSKNVLMLGYYNNDEWNLIYRTDELSGFNKDIDTDGETYVNVTLWRDLSYGGYDFRLAIRYCLGVDDNQLTIIPYIKNLDSEDIPFVLGFGWEMKDIQINMTTSGDYININGTMYYLNQSLDNTYTDLPKAEFYLMENISDGNLKSLYLKWNQSLNYKLRVKSTVGQYNAPVTLFIRIGTLDSGDEKMTKMYWYDADQAVYYFDMYSMGEAWATNPSYMVNGITSYYASTMANGDVELCNGNNCSGTDLGTISNVEIRCYGYYSGGQRDTILRPVFGGTTDGLDYHYHTPPAAGGGWSQWFIITCDPFAPQSWDWSDVDNLDCDVEAEYSAGPPSTLFCSKVELRVTYTCNNPPVISSPNPADNSVNVSITPTLSINVSDPEGDNMNISWLSNSSGSWQVFGTNSSVGNGTYYQVMSNVSVNGQWWYWKINVTDGIDYVESGVYKFFTGVQSKIKNTGSTDIKGFLLIELQFYKNNSWIFVDDMVNESTWRTINASEQFGLDTVFNGLLNTSMLTYFGNGTYLIYAAFRDPNGNILIGDDEAELIAIYEFTVTFE
jgi:PKD repeat protein